MLRRSSWCDSSGLGVIPAGKNQDVGPGQFYEPSVLLCQGKKFADYCSWLYHAFLMQNLQ